MDEDAEAQVDLRRETAIRAAVSAADRIIMDFSDGSNEETNYLTAKVALEFVGKAFIPFHSALLRADLERRARARRGEA